MKHTKFFKVSMFTVLLAMLLCLMLVLTMVACNNQTDTTCDHNIVTDRAVSPTCENTGLTKGKHCSKCGEVILEQQVIPATGHTNAEAVIENNIDATCTTAGSFDEVVYCSVCDVEISRESITVDALGHDVITHDAQKPTCTEVGWEAYETCSRCDYTTYEEIGSVGHSPKQSVVENVIDPTCTTEGSYDSVVYCDECGDELSRTTIRMSILGHDAVPHNSKEPTCTEVGWNAYVTCSRCDHTTYAEIPATGHDHEAVVTDPTCTEEGYTTYTCHCGDEYTADVVPATGHDPASAVQENIVPATCLTAGSFDNVVYCTSCGVEISREKIAIDALGHDLIPHEGKEPTCTEIGWEAYETCSRCDHTTYVEIPATGHDHEAVVTAPTCTEEGYTTYTCHCGDTYIADKVDATGHDYEAVVTTPTCTEKGYTTYTCHCGDTYVADEISALGHAPAKAIQENIVLATCLSAGSYDSVVYCDTCGKELSRDAKTVAALGHDIINHEAQAPTCTEIGWNAYETCSRCDHTTYVEIPATGHNHEASVTDPTCTEEGYTTYTCHCGDTYVADEVPALGHTPADEVIYNKVAATCTTPGKYDRDVYCEICDAEISSETVVVPALGHDIINHEAQAPTCTEIGWNAYETCSRCDHTTYAEIPATGHKESATKRENYIEATCTLEGSYDRVVNCTVCGVELLRETKIVDALGHDVVNHEGKENTCTELGWKAYETCTRCAYTTYTEIPAGHDIQSYKAKAPTCTEIGWNAYESCSRCDYTTYVEIPATGHNHEAVVTAPTCTKEGYTTHTCHCGDTYRTDVVPATGHNHEAVVTAPTCTNGGYTTYSCHCGDVYIADEVPATGHDPAKAVQENIVSATCLKTGSYDSVVYCDTCGKEISRDAKTINALGHDTEVHSAKAPTCTEIGWNAYETCSRCDHSTYVEVPATGHSPKTAVVENNIDPTCTTAGSYDSVVYCATCDVEISRDTEIVSALGHDVINHNGKAPTCTDLGWKAYETCTRCAYTTYTEIPVTDHTYDNNCDAECNVCGGMRVPSSHIYTNSCDTTCNECGDARAIEHTYSSDCDSICNVCSFERVTEANHTYDNTCDTTCNECGNVRTIEHTYSSDCDSICNVCSTKRTTTASHIDINPADNSCDGCGVKVSTLTFTLSDDGKSYSITGTDSSISGDIVLPSTYNEKPVTTIGSSAFDSCYSLISIVIPDSVTTIGTCAFYYCTSLTSVTIGNSVTTIDYLAFSSCLRLVEVFNKSKLDIVAGVEEHGSIGLRALNVYTKEGGSKLSTDEDGYIIYTDGEARILVAYIGDQTDLIIPDGITEINESAFRACTSLTSIVIPDSVTSIGRSAFSVCTSLTSVTFGENSQLTTIGRSAFSSCESLTSITIPDSVTTIGDYAFDTCDSLTSIVIPDSVTTIGSSAFSECTGLTSITIPDSVTTIGDYAFYKCTSLTSVTFGANSQLTSIGNYAFAYCDSLTSITIPDSVTTIGKYAFDSCESLTSITFEDTTTWYRTSSETNFTNKTGGTNTTVSNASTNATYFRSTYYNYYWYKL